jgi:hypothetical protein
MTSKKELLLPLSMNQSTLREENLMVQKSSKIWRHFGKFTLIILAIKLILFTLGTYIENGTLEMGLLTVIYLIGFISISILMIKTYKRSTKLHFIEKLFSVTLLFLSYEIFGNLLHFVYFTLILGQNPSRNEVLNKTLEILLYDSFMLVLTILVVAFINSKVIEVDS